MTDSPALQSWIATVTDEMPHLSKPQALVLAWWSFGHGSPVPRNCLTNWLRNPVLPRRQMCYWHGEFAGQIKRKVTLIKQLFS